MWLKADLIKSRLRNAKSDRQLSGRVPGEDQTAGQSSGSAPSAQETGESVEQEQ